MNVTRVPRGTIRRIMRRHRGEIVAMTASSPIDTETLARNEISATIPVYNSDVGRSELATLMARAARNSR